MFTKLTKRFFFFGFFPFANFSVRLYLSNNFVLFFPPLRSLCCHLIDKIIGNWEWCEMCFGYYFLLQPGDLHQFFSVAPSITRRNWDENETRKYDCLNAFSVFFFFFSGTSASFPARVWVGCCLYKRALNLEQKKCGMKQTRKRGKK